MESDPAAEAPVRTDLEMLAMRNLVLEKRIRRLEAMMRSKGGPAGPDGIFPNGERGT